MALEPWDGGYVRRDDTAGGYTSSAGRSGGAARTSPPAGVRARARLLRFRVRTDAPPRAAMP